MSDSSLAKELEAASARWEALPPSARAVITDRDIVGRAAVRRQEEAEPSDARLGLYRHFKGGMYRLIDIVPMATGDSMDEIVYYASLVDGKRWARTAEDFFAEVNRDGLVFSRFTKVSEDSLLFD